VLRGGETALSASESETGDERFRPARASVAAPGPLAKLSRRPPELLRRPVAGDVDADEHALVGVAAGLRTTG
jgi:hypothetical protein